MSKPKKKKWVVILNPHAGSGKGKKDQLRILERLDKKGLDYKLAVSAYPGNAIALTVKAIEKGYRKIIVAGGDGTLNEVVNGVFTQTSCKPSKILIGMIPVGTGNDWIKTFGVPNNYKDAVKVLKEGKTMRQDVGRINYSVNGITNSRYFANMAGFGFDAMVASRSNQLKDKGRKGLILYLQALVSSLNNYQTRKMNIMLDGQVIEDMIFSVSIGIGRFNGGGMMQAPGAIPDNGLFQVTIIRKIGFWGILRNISGLYTGKFIRDRRVSCFQAKSIEINSDVPIASEADGEIVGMNSYRIEIIPRSLIVIFNPQNFLS